MGRRLERHLDEDLIDRIAAGWTPSKDKPKKMTKLPRPEWTYRAFWRNAHRLNSVMNNEQPVGSEQGGPGIGRVEAEQ